MAKGITYQTNTGKVFYQSSSQHSSDHANTSTTNKINTNILNSGYDNTITAKDLTTGKEYTYEGKVVDGVTYTSSGDRIIPGGNSNQSGIIPADKNGILFVERDKGKGSTYVEFVSKPEKSGVPDPPSAPQFGPAPDPPVYEVFSLPYPTFSSRLQREKRYTYFMGIDKIEAKSIKSSRNSIRHTQTFSVKGAESISILANHYSGETSSIEYYIQEGEERTPILPEGQHIVENEKLFPNLPLRFDIVGEPIAIRKDETKVDIKLADAQGLTGGSLGDYYVTYETRNADTYYPRSKDALISLVIIMRTLTEDGDPPHINDVKVKLNGGEDTLWQEQL